MAIEPRKAIPAAVARELRQQAGFGCCKCGSPILQYHHIIPWSQEQHFRLEDMMALCPTHHDQATKGAMPVTEQRELKSKPYNVERGFAFGLLEVKQDYCAADLGSVTVVGEGCFIRIDNDEILSFSMGPKNLQISLKLYSEANELLLEIDKNDWISGDPSPWDIEADWQTLILREKLRKISITLDAKKIPLTISGEFWHSTKRVTVDKKQILVHGSPCMGLANLALVGGGIDVSTDKMVVAPNGGAIVSWSNPRERFWKARDIWKKIAAERNAAGP